MPTRAPAACTERTCCNPQPCPDHPRLPWGGSGRIMEPGWNATRARILRRDPICRLAMCGGSPSTEVHHTHGPALGDDAHLIGVCHDCHAIVTQATAAAARWADR